MTNIQKTLARYGLVSGLGGIAFLGACGQNSSTPLALAPASTSAATSPAATALIFQGDDTSATAVDVALAAAVRNLPETALGDRQLLATAAEHLLGGNATIEPATISPLPTAASLDFAPPADTLDLADLAVLLAGSNVGGNNAEAIAAAATRVLGTTILASDLRGIPGLTLPGDLGDAGGAALLVRDDARLALASGVVEAIDRLPSRTPAGGNVFFPPGTEILFPTAPDPERALRVSYEPPLSPARTDPPPFSAEDLGCVGGACQLPEIAFVVPQGFVAEEDTYRATFAFRDVNGAETVIERALSVTAPEPLDIASSFADSLRSLPDIPASGSLTTATIAGITAIDVSDTNLNSVRGISVFTALQQWIATNNAVSDLSPFAEFGPNETLQTFRMENNQLSDISAIANFANLSAVFLSGNAISDLSPLSTLDNIGTLFLDGNPVADLSPLSSLSKITELQAREIRTSAPALDLNPLGNLSTLERLDLSANNIDDLAALSGLNQLRSLALNNNQISTLSGLASLANLEALALANNQIESVVPLANLTELRSLVIFENQIRDIQPLAGLRQLQELLIANSQIEDFAPLTSLTSLVQLGLEGTGISNLLPLNTLVEIQVLDLADNSITTVAPLLLNSGLDAGDCVDLRGNPLDENSTALLIPQLQSRGVDVPFLPTDPPCELRLF